MNRYEVTPIGTVESPLTSLADAPKQADEGAPSVWLAIDAAFAAALDGIEPGDAIVVLTWLHQARRDVLRIHPRGDPNRAEQGVFATRSPDRPNPIGLHDVVVVAVDGHRVGIDGLEAIDGTPVVDIKPNLAAPGAR